VKYLGKVPGAKLRLVKNYILRPHNGIQTKQGYCTLPPFSFEKVLESAGFIKNTPLQTAFFQGPYRNCKGILRIPPPENYFWFFKEYSPLQKPESGLKGGNILSETCWWGLFSENLWSSKNWAWRLAPKLWLPVISRRWLTTGGYGAWVSLFPEKKFRFSISKWLYGPNGPKREGSKTRTPALPQGVQGLQQLSHLRRGDRVLRPSLRCLCLYRILETFFPGENPQSDNRALHMTRPRGAR